MPEISFYILSSDEERLRSFFCCQLIEKAYRQGVFCYLLTNSEHQTRMLDNLLWTFRPNSFIPHEIYSGELPTIDNIVLIGSLLPPEAWQKTVINFSTYILEDLTHITRLLDIIDNHPERKQAGKDRYRYYQQQGLKIQTLQI